MDGNSKRRDEVQQILLALLAARKGSTPLPVLDNDYVEMEGSWIPWKEFGYASLLDFLQSMPSTIYIERRCGVYTARPVNSEKIKHITSLVSRQHSSKATGHRRMPRSNYFPSPTSARSYVSADVLSTIVTIIEEHPDGVNKDFILNKVHQQLPYINITLEELEHQLKKIPHKVSIGSSKFYPIESTIMFKRNNVTKTKSDNQKVTSGNVGSAPQYYVSGDGHSSDEDDLTEGFAFGMMQSNIDTNRNLKHNKKSTSSFLQETVYKHEQNDDNKNGHGNVSNRNDYTSINCSKVLTDKENNNKLVDDLNKEYGEILINDRVKLRLQQLIQKYPDGIRAAELPQKYLDEYKVSLNYTELGFNSVQQFASQLPDVFHVLQPFPYDDYLLVDARKEIPQSSKQNTNETVTNSSKFFTKEDMVPLPTVLSNDTSKKLSPEGVMTIGESVRSIDVSSFENNPKDHLEVYVVEVFTPSFFWIHLRKQKADFSTFMEAIHQFYTAKSDCYHVSPVVLQVGLNCACKYQGAWHRGIVKDIKPDFDKVTVLFYDYGTLKTYSPGEIYHLHRKFSNLPAQAIPCGLVNVKPCSGEAWTRGVTHEFAIRTAQIPLIATIASTDKENNSMMISLTDTLQPEDVHIADWMVERNLAVYGKMVDNVEMKNILLYVEENLLYKPELCYAKEDCCCKHGNVESPESSNVPLVSPLSTLEAKPVGPPPGFTLPANSYNLNDSSKNPDPVICDDNTKTGNTPLLNNSNVNTNPFLQDDSVTNEYSGIMTQEVFLHMCWENLKLQREIAVFRKLFAELLLNPLNCTPESILLGYERAKQYEHQLAQAAKAFENLDVKDYVKTVSQTMESVPNFSGVNGETPVSSSHTDFSTSTPHPTAVNNSFTNTFLHNNSASVFNVPPTVDGHHKHYQNSDHLPSDKANDHNYAPSNHVSEGLGTGHSQNANVNKNPFSVPSCNVSGRAGCGCKNSFVKKSEQSTQTDFDEVADTDFSVRNQSFCPPVETNPFKTNFMRNAQASEMLNSTERPQHYDNNVKDYMKPLSHNFATNSNGFNKDVSQSENTVMQNNITNGSHETYFADAFRIYNKNDIRQTISEMVYQSTPVTCNGKKKESQQNNMQRNKEAAKTESSDIDYTPKIHESKEYINFKLRSQQYKMSHGHPETNIFKNECKASEHSNFETSQKYYNNSSQSFMEDSQMNNHRNNKFHSTPEPPAQNNNFGSVTLNHISNDNMSSIWTPFNTFLLSPTLDNSKQDTNEDFSLPLGFHNSKGSSVLTSTADERKNKSTTDMFYMNENPTTAEVWFKSVENSINGYTQMEKDKGLHQPGETVPSMDGEFSIKNNLQRSFDRTPGGNGLRQTVVRNLAPMSETIKELPLSENSIHNKTSRYTGEPIEADDMKLTVQEHENFWNSVIGLPKNTSNSNHSPIIDYGAPIIFRGIELVNKTMYIFHFEEEGWLSIDEFITAFTVLKSASFMMNMLEILNISPTVKDIFRSEYPTIFSQLDATSLNATRENGKISKISLIGLNSAIIVLLKLKIVKSEDMDNAIERKEFVKGSIVHEIWMLLNAYGVLKQLINQAKEERC